MSCSRYFSAGNQTWGRGGATKGKAGGSSATVSKHEILENLAFADDERPASRNPALLIGLVGDSNYNLTARSRGGKVAQHSPFDGDAGGCLPLPGSTEAFRRSHSCQAAAYFIQIPLLLRLHKTPCRWDRKPVKRACPRASSNLPVPAVILRSPLKGRKPYTSPPLVFFPV
jgi:hypothetical protein